jgi:hypothetical protein
MWGLYLEGNLHLADLQRHMVLKLDLGYASFQGLVGELACWGSEKVLLFGASHAQVMIAWNVFHETGKFLILQIFNMDQVRGNRHAGALLRPSILQLAEFQQCQGDLYNMP